MTRSQSKGVAVQRQGVALVLTLAIVLVVGLLVLASAVTGVIDRTMSANQLRSNAAYYAAQSGLELYKTAVFRNLVDFYAETGSGWCESPLSGGITDGEGNEILSPGTWTGWEPLDGGTYRVRLDLSDAFLVLTAEGAVGDALSTVQLVATAGGGPASAWDNAILARGTTPGSKAINGNVTVYGSVHIVSGDIETPLSLSGTAGIFNTYNGSGTSNSVITSDLIGIVDTSVDLCARVKIAQGNIYLESGSIELGAASDPLYSIHLGDGVVCREKEDVDGGCRPRNIIDDHTESALVHLLYPESGGINSPYGPFDLDLPVLQQAAINRAFKTDVAGVPVSGCEWLYSGGVVRLPPASNVTSTMCGDATNSIRWVAGSPGYLVIDGDINIPTVDVTVPDLLLYEGKGTLLVGANLDDSGALVTITGSMRPRIDNSYPLDSAIAVMSTGGVTYGSTAAEDPTAALIYAKGTFTAEKQVLIVGAVVADNFDLGTNVPKIAYHPDVRFAAEDLCLPGTACAGDGAPQNPGVLADIAIERR